MSTEMAWRKMQNTTEAPGAQRRIWFTIHALAYLMLFLPLDMIGLTLRAGLLATLLVHFAWLSVGSTGVVRCEWQSAEAVSALMPLLPDGKPRGDRPSFDRNDFWFQWHDLS